MIKYRKHLKVTLILLVIAIIIMLKIRLNLGNTEDIVGLLNGFQSSYVAVAVFISISAVASICCIPISWFKAFGAIYFGFAHGVVYGILATTISATLSFFLARAIGKDAVNRLYENKIKPKLNEKQISHLDRTSDIGFLQLFVLRNLYFIPFSATNYLMGISSISFKTYIMGTIVGIVPGTTLYIYLISNSLNPISLLSEFKFLYGILPIYYGGIFLLNKRYKNQLA